MRIEKNQPPDTGSFPHWTGAAESAPLVRAEFLKHIYCGLLLHVPLETVGEFWTRHPLPGAAPDISTTLKTIWECRTAVPFGYLTAVYNEVAGILDDPGAVAKFAENTSVTLNRGLPVPARAALQWGKLFIAPLLKADDPRHFLLQLMDHLTPWLTMGIVHRLVHDEVSAQGRKSIMLYMCSDISKPLQAGNAVFGRPLPQYDFGSWTAQSIQLLPRGLNLPAYERMKVIADCRTPRFILPTAHINTQSERLIIDGRECGSTILLSRGPLPGSE